MRFFLFDSCESPLSIGLIKKGVKKYDSVPLKAEYALLTQENFLKCLNTLLNPFDEILINFRIPVGDRKIQNGRGVKKRR